MAEVLTILGAIALGVVGNAVWDLCKSIYKQRNEFVLLNLSSPNQPLQLSASSTRKEKTIDNPFRWPGVVWIFLYQPIIKKGQSKSGKLEEEIECQNKFDDCGEACLA